MFYIPKHPHINTSTNSTTLQVPVSPYISTSETTNEMSNPLDIDRKREYRMNQEFLRQFGHPYADYVDPTYPGESFFELYTDPDNRDKPKKPNPYLTPNQTGTYLQAVDLVERPDGKHVNTWNHWERPAHLGYQTLSYRSAYTNPDTGEQRFFCDCGDSFAYVTNRARHERTHHGIRAADYR